ncbi:MAG: CAP domain-containing protein [Saprospiraceae bacterium]|nr:CAP domain-containing protein [Saprospiraceae bacterium]
MKKKIVILFCSCLSLASCSWAQQLVSNPKNNTSSYVPTESGDFRADMLTAVNLVRSRGCRCGNKTMPAVPPVRWNSQLEAAAIRHAADMARNKHFDHIGTDGSELDNRVEAAGYKWMQIGENIAWGYTAIADAMKGWIESPSHCQQLMSPKVDEMGAAKNGKYWVQDFGKQRTW